MNDTIIEKDASSSYKRLTLDEYHKEKNELYKTADDYYKEGGTGAEVYDFIIPNRSTFKQTK